MRDQAALHSREASTDAQRAANVYDCGPGQTQIPSTAAPMVLVESLAWTRNAVACNYLRFAGVRPSASEGKAK